MIYYKKNYGGVGMGVFLCWGYIVFLILRSLKLGPFKG
jgi:hypothetical protein